MSGETNHRPGPDMHHRTRRRRRRAVRAIGVMAVDGFLLLIIAMIMAWPAGAGALTPEEVLVVANLRNRDSLSLARFYMEKRRIPPGRLVTVSAPIDENCSRTVYEESIAAPVRRYLEKDSGPKPGVRCLVLMQGIPLRIESLSDLVAKGLRYMSGIGKNGAEPSAPPSAGRGRTNKQPHQKPIGTLSRQASVDSEIALVRQKGYPLAGWVRNPFFLGWKNLPLPVPKKNVLMVSRLDGPSPEIVRRLIDDSIRAEVKGLTGNASFDARWPDTASPGDDGYRRFDAMIHRTADLVREDGRLPVRVDDSKRLFRPGACPKTALYVGWYSRANYVDAFAWQPGAVGYHVASSECTTLKKKSSRVWCKMMLEKGIAATVGPVGEPYVQAFPVPQIFFGYLLDGYLTLAEAYLISTPFLSWKMVLIGDPLYRPFSPRS